jgi:hypothetical protein
MAQFYSAMRAWFTLRAMWGKTFLRRYLGWAPIYQALAMTALGLGLGAGVLPVLIYAAGVVLLGRYENAGLGHLFGSLYSGLATGSLASWIVVLGPCLLFLLFRALVRWWRWGKGEPSQA